MAGFDTRQFVVSSTSPGISESSNSSYDDNQDNTQGSNAGRTEQRLYVINRAGTGEVHYLLLTSDRTRIQSYKIETEVWEQLQNVVHFGVVVVRNCLYVIGGYDKSTAKHLRRVLK